ncbi:hypothetical protein [uncultured Bilophila sp.]|nr:hypothetical protein [uncultured Bilophila sp.]
MFPQRLALGRNRHAAFSEASIYVLMAVGALIAALPVIFMGRPRSA